MVWKFSTSVPEMVGEIDVVVVDTSIDDGDDDTIACVSYLPNIISIDLGDVLRQSAFTLFRFFYFLVPEHVLLLVKTNQHYIRVLR